MSIRGSNADGRSMDSHARDDRDTLAARRTNVLSHLDGTLDEQMLHAMQGYQ